jgi:hypothetical protein
MIFVLVLLVVDAVLAVHAAQTGRWRPWGYVILALPGIGALAYVVGPCVNEWLSTYRAEKARRGIARALAPERRYRALRDRLALSDANTDRVALAKACCDLELFDEARLHYQAILRRPQDGRLNGDCPIRRAGAL